MKVLGFEDAEFYKRAMALRQSLIIARPTRADVGSMCLNWGIDIGPEHIIFDNSDDDLIVMCTLNNDDKDTVYTNAEMLTKELYDELYVVLRRFEIAAKCKLYALEGFTARDLKIKEDSQ